VWGTVFGVFLVAVAVNGLSLLGAQGWVNAVFNGAALVVAVAVSTTIARLRNRRATASQYAAIRGDHELPPDEVTSTQPGIEQETVSQ
jgi:ribose transport system permease protein